MRYGWRLRAHVLLIVALLPAACTTAAGDPDPGNRSGSGVRDLAQAAPESVGISSERLQRLEARMQRLVDEGKLAGVVTLLARDGKIAHFHAVGAKDISTADPIQKDSIFRIYSMTKPITGVAMMILYEEGKWRLNDPVSNYIPEFAKLKVHAGEDRNGKPILEDASRTMTMRELMSHSAGLAYGLGDTNPVDRMYREIRVLDSSAPLQVMIDKLAALPLLAQPRTRWYYSIAVDVQGYLVEKLSGQSFPDFLQQRVFAPLGMKDTAFYVAPEKVNRLAKIHTQDENGKLVPPSPRRDQNVSAPPAGPSGGGGLFSTAEDYVRFSQMLLDGGELNGVRILAPRTVEMMRTNHLSEHALGTMRPGLGFGLDFGVVLDAAATGEPYGNGSYYWSGAAGTWFWIDPVTDLVFVGMIQHQGRSVGEVQGVSRNLTYQSIVEPAR